MQSFQKLFLFFGVTKSLVSLFLLDFARFVTIHSLLNLLQVKGLSKEELAARNDLVLALPERIQSIRDGTATAAKQGGGWGVSASRTEIRFDSTSGDLLLCHKSRSHR